MPSSAKPKRFTLKALIGVCLMMIFGTGTMISSKFLLDTKARGCVDGAKEKNFDKALYQSIVMFFGMAVCLPVYFISKLLGFQKAKDAPTNEVLSENEKKKNRSKTIINYLLIAVPASFDLIATTMMTFGLFFIKVSITQMLRGSMIIFSAVLTVFVRKRKLASFQWLGVILCSVAIVIVGLSSILGNKDDKTHVAVGLQLLGILLVISSQFVQASQVVVEDYLLGDLNAPALVVVGMEGIWGFLLSTVVFMPLFYFIPGSDGTGGITWWKSDIGHLEDMFDTICMIVHQPYIVYGSLVYWFCIIILNYGGMVVTQETSAVVRTIFEALRTFFIWVVQVFIYYAIKTQQYGEKLTYFSIMELIGFLLLVSSLFVYNAVIKLRCIPFLKYDKPAPAPDAVPEESAFTDIAYESMNVIVGHPPADPYKSNANESHSLAQPLLQREGDYVLNRDQNSNV